MTPQSCSIFNFGVDILCDVLLHDLQSRLKTMSIRHNLEVSP